MAKPDLALVVPEGLFGGKGGGGKRPPMHAEPDADEAGGPSDMDADNGGGEFDVAADEFLDDTLPPDERKAALKRAIMACMGEDY